MSKLLISLFLSAFLSFNASAIEVGGVSFKDTIAESGLTLNGAGIRYKVFFKIYAAALYVETPSQDATTLITQDGNKRLIMHILYGDIEREKMVNSMIEGFKDNLSSDEYSALKKDIDNLLTHYQGVKEGDVLMFDYTPDKGTTFNLNGVDKVTIQGAAFNQALLKIWLGDNPATDSLKRDLLGSNS